MSAAHGSAARGTDRRIDVEAHSGHDDDTGAVHVHVELDTPDFPEAWKGEAEEGKQALAVYRAEAGDLDWTFLSPAAVIGPGERTGRYRTTDETLLTDAQGDGRISYEDYAVAAVDELEQPHHVGKRFGVAY